MQFLSAQTIRRQGAVKIKISVVGCFGFGARKRWVGAETHLEKKALAAFRNGFGLRNPNMIVAGMKTRGNGMGRVRIGVGVGSGARTGRASNAIQ